jgi:penicillin-binding protein 2
MELGPYKFANWYFTEYGRKEEGGVDVVKALKRSNDIFFYRLGQDTGEKLLGDFSKRLGLGEKLGIDIPGEVTGLIPDGDWKQKNFDQPWYPGDTLHMSIGQGFVLATPLQINNLTMTIASGGNQYPPHLAMKITTPLDFLIKKFKFDPINKKDFKKQDIELVKKGLEEVPLQGGTAWPFFNFPVKTAGKTGTAEFGDPKNKTHAWYTSYAPIDDPKIVMTVMVEAGGEGSSVAGPIAKEVYRYYFSPDKNNLLKDIAPIATDSARILGE